MSNIITLDLENAVFKFHEIVDHTFDILVPRIRLDLKFKHITLSNYNLRKLIKLKKKN